MLDKLKAHLMQIQNPRSVAETLAGFLARHPYLVTVMKRFIVFARCLHYTLEEMIEAEDKVIVRFTFHGTHEGEYRNIPPTGKKVSYTGIGIWRLAEGKFVEHWSNVDLFGLM